MKLECDDLQLEYPIEMFTQGRPLFRMVYCSFLADLIKVKRSGKGEYIYDDQYPFRCLSDLPLLKGDKKPRGCRKRL